MEEQEADYIGKEALERIRREGVSRKLVGIELEGDRSTSPRSTGRVAHGETVGHVTDACWSPRLEKNIGYVWVPIELAEPGTRLDVETDDGTRHGHHRDAPVHRPQQEGPRRVGPGNLGVVRPLHGVRDSTTFENTPASRRSDVRGVAWPV